MIGVLSRHESGGIDLAGAEETRFNGKIYVSAGVGWWGGGVVVFFEGGLP